MNQATSDRATQEKILHIHRWTSTLFTIKTSRPAGYQFTPGQYARLGLQVGDDMVWRAYSIVSTPQDDHLEYYGVLVPGGTFTSRLTAMNVGDTIWTEKQPYGFMTAERFADGDDLWMLATGTGIGPFISILRDPAVWKKFRQLILVHCVRQADEFAYQDEMNEMAAAPPFDGGASLRYIRSATRTEGSAPDVLNERITVLLESGKLERLTGIMMTPETSRVMLCGNPQMIEDTRALLHARNMRPLRRMQPGQFVTENYW